MTAVIPETAITETAASPSAHSPFRQRVAIVASLVFVVVVAFVFFISAVQRQLTAKEQLLVGAWEWQSEPGRMVLYFDDRAGCVNCARPDLRGGDLNCAWIQYCDTTTGNQVANREYKPYPKHKRIALLTAELRWCVYSSFRTLLGRVGGAPTDAPKTWSLQFSSHQPESW
jgi:hypothetical protein